MSELKAYGWNDANGDHIYQDFGDLQSVLMQHLIELREIREIQTRCIGRLCTNLETYIQKEHPGK